VRNIIPNANAAYYPATSESPGAMLAKRKLDRKIAAIENRRYAV
jgi:hypothetical protein